MIGEEKKIRLYVLCNDLFAWGCADAEELSEDQIPVLADCVGDRIARGGVSIVD